MNSPLRLNDKPLTVRLVYGQLLRIALLYAGVAVFAGAPLVLFGMNWTPRQLSFITRLSLPVTGAAALLVDLISVTWVFRPIRPGLRSIESGQPDRTLVQATLAHMLNLPLTTFGRVWLAHTPASILASLGSTVYLNNRYDLGISGWQLATSLSIALTVAASHSILEYFAALRTVRRVLPALCRAAEPLPADFYQRIPPTSVRRRLLFITICMTFIPFVVLSASTIVRVNAMLADAGVADTAPQLRPLVLWLLLLFGVVTVLMIAMALLMSRDIQQLAGDLAAAMRTVEAGDINTRVVVTSTDEFSQLYRGFNRMTQGLQERERLRDAFGRYISPELAEQVIQNGVTRSGATVDATVLFVDIRDYTALSEQLSADTVVNLLNALFAQLEPVIKAEGGWINKFTGDGFIALFGTPVRHDDHSPRAVRAALGLRAALAQFNADQRTRSQPTLRIGIALAAGDMVAGSIGSPDRIEYTVIGDPVNVASRIEQLNKTLGTDLLISESVYQAVRNSVTAEPMPPARVKGKAEPIRVYAIR